MGGTRHRALVVLLVSCACGQSNGSRTTAGGPGQPTASDSGVPGFDDAEAGEAGEAGENGEAGDDDPGMPSGGFKFDLAPAAGTDDNCQDGTDGDGSFSYIWIANSAEGTVSKIDTQTGTEEGRYAVSGGSPSRTSVNLYGDVAVSSRFPSMVTKIAAREADCIDKNGNGMIETSTGPADVMLLGTDECVLWETPVPALSHETGARPTAWEGVLDPDPSDCEVPPARLWIAFKLLGNAVVWRLDGETGQKEDEVILPWIHIGGGAEYGPYGGAVNAEGDLWISGVYESKLAHIDSVTLAVTEYPNPGVGWYGIGLDANGNPWMAGYWDEATAVFDVASQQFVQITGTFGGHLRGIQVDRFGRAWAAGNEPCRLVQFDVPTRTVAAASIPLPGCVTPVGVSIDADDYVWVVDMGANKAFKVDPDTHAVALEVTGLNEPYTYSDMTGAGLNLVVNPPG